VTRIYQVPLLLALLHQAMAMMVQPLAVLHAERLARPKAAMAGAKISQPSAA